MDAIVSLESKLSLRTWHFVSQTHKRMPIFFGRCVALERISVLRQCSSSSCTSLRPFFLVISSSLSGDLKYPLGRQKRILRILAGYAPRIYRSCFFSFGAPYPGDRMLDGGVVWSGDEKAGERALNRWRTFLKPFEDTIPIISIWRSSAPLPASSLLVTIRAIEIGAFCGA